MDRTEYLVQAMSRSTGASPRWVPVGRPTVSLVHAQRIADERRATNGRRVIYRVVTRSVTEWTEVTS